MSEVKEKTTICYERELETATWHIYGTRQGRYLTCKKGFLDKFLGKKVEHKDVEEPPEEYISRLIKTGIMIRSENLLCIIKNRIGLEFIIEKEQVITADQKSRYRSIDTGHHFEGSVKVNSHHLNLKYLGWDVMAKLFLDSSEINDKGKRIPEPDNIHYFS